MTLKGQETRDKGRRTTHSSLRPSVPPSLRASRGMTLVETLVAITILSLSVVAPMALTMQSLSAAYYARDQMVASNLAQEAIEAVRAVRDGNILMLALSEGALCPSDGQPISLLCGIPIDQNFIIDARTNPPSITNCGGVCPPLKTDGNLYGHEVAWVDETPFRRTVRVEYVSGGEDEIRITVTVENLAGARPRPPVIIRENLYRWVEDGSGG